MGVFTVISPTPQAYIVIDSPLTSKCMQCRAILVILVLPVVSLLLSCSSGRPKAGHLSNSNSSNSSELCKNCKIESIKFKDPTFDISQIISDYDSLCLKLRSSSKNEFKATSYLFDSSIRFFQDTFTKNADISYSTFKHWADFSHTKFDSDANFISDTIQNFGLVGASINKDLIFNKTQFIECAYFNELVLGDTSKLYFLNTSLPDSLFFPNIIKIPSEIDLTQANFTDPVRFDDEGEYIKHNILFYHTDISKFYFNYQYFNLIFDDFKHNIHITGDEKTALFEGVLKNFKDRGQLESYRLLDIEYQKYKWGRPYFHWLWWVPHYWWNYGYTKELVFFWVFIFVLAFTTINFFYLKYLNNKVYKMDFIPSRPTYNFRRRTRLWLAFLYTCSIFFRFSLNYGRLKFNKIGSVIYILLIYILGLICIAYMANFIIQK